MSKQFEFFFFSGLLEEILFLSLMQNVQSVLPTNSEIMNCLSSKVWNCDRGPPAKGGLWLVTETVSGSGVESRHHDG